MVVVDAFFATWVVVKSPKLVVGSWSFLTRDEESEERNDQNPRAPKTGR